MGLTKYLILVLYYFFLFLFSYDLRLRMDSGFETATDKDYTMYCLLLLLVVCWTVFFKFSNWTYRTNCTDKIKTRKTNKTRISFIVDKDGAQVQFLRYNITLDIPCNAVDQKTRVSFRVLTDTKTLMITNKADIVMSCGLSCRPSSLVFKKSCKLTLPHCVYMGTSSRFSFFSKTFDFALYTRNSISDVIKRDDDIYISTFRENGTFSFSFFKTQNIIWPVVVCKLEKNVTLLSVLELYVPVADNDSGLIVRIQKNIKGLTRRKNDNEYLISNEISFKTKDNNTKKHNISYQIFNDKSSQSINLPMLKIRRLLEWEYCFQQFKKAECTYRFDINPCRSGNPILFNYP